MPGATAAATAAPGRRRAITIGRSRPLSSRSSARPEHDQRARRSRLARHQRERLVLAVLARAQRGDGRLVVGAAGEVIAADALDGDDEAVEQRAPPPRRDGVAAAASAPSSRARGPHSGHAFGSAWKRRSSGSSYSALQAAHIAKPAIVVRARSYGTPRTIVKRGPQSVQLTNG